MSVLRGGVTVIKGRTRKRVGFISLGCAKNLVNSEQMMFLLDEAGFLPTDKTQDVEAVVVNTCAFIESAKTEAIETILELGRIKETGALRKIIVAGCLPQRYGTQVLEEMPEVDALIGVGSFGDIAEAVKTTLNSEERSVYFGDIDAPVSETGRIITTSPVWTYLKIAEGCDNRCAYCVIPDIRGPYRSRPVEKIVGEAKWLAGVGIKELIIVAQDVTKYGSDLYGKNCLAELLSALCRIDGIEWIRLHYLYPGEISKELIDVINENDKILKYIDMPIQHISDSILKEMNRRTTGGEIKSIVQYLRDSIPGVVLRTSLITGLPGEGEEEFEELCDFLREARIERAGVFAYSPEEGTKAALMERPDTETALKRAELVSDIQGRIMDNFNSSRIGSTVTVLIEGCEEGHYYGRSYAESPDVDGYISVGGENLEPGMLVRARITGAEDGEPEAVAVRNDI